MNNAKESLRKKLKQARLELTDAEYSLKSRNLVEKLKHAIDWSRVKSLHYFDPIIELFEPNISDLINYLQEEYPDIELFTPKLIEGEWQMVAAKEGNIPDLFDIVLVPMLAFDKSLNRIGYGGGYYDKFLSTQPNTQKIGASFDLSLVDNVPVEPHDIPMNMIVTETKIYS